MKLDDLKDYVTASIGSSGTTISRERAIALMRTAETMWRGIDEELANDAQTKLDSLYATAQESLTTD